MRGLPYQLKSVLRDKFCLMTFLLPILAAAALSMMGAIDLSSLGELHFGVLEDGLSPETTAWLERYGPVTAYETRSELAAAIREPSTNVIGVEADGAGIRMAVAGDELDIFQQAAATLPALYAQRETAAQAEVLTLERPDILCLDEPSNDIDIQTLEWLGDFIRRTPLPVLFISHDEMLLGQTANKIIHFEQLQRKTKPRHTVAATGYEAYIGNRQQAFARQEQMARRERSEYEKKQERFRRIQQKVEHQQNIITRQDPHGGQLLKKKMHAVKAMERRYEKEAEQMSEFPQTEEAIFIRFGDKTSLPAGKRVLDFYCKKLCAAGQVLAQDIRLTVCGPQHVCIVGKNGAGKTTLLKQIAKELSGRTDLNVFYMPQNYEELLGQEQTPVEFLSVEAGREEAGRIRTYLGSMKFSADEMAHPVSMLSGGQKAKLLLLKVSMQGCNVLLLDEPTRNFSPLSAPVIRAMLKDYGGAIISVSHDRRYIEEVCTEVYELTANGLERTRL